MTPCPYNQMATQTLGLHFPSPPYAQDVSCLLLACASNASMWKSFGYGVVKYVRYGSRQLFPPSSHTPHTLPKLHPTPHLTSHTPHPTSQTPHFTPSPISLKPTPS